MPNGNRHLYSGRTDRRNGCAHGAEVDEVRCCGRVEICPYNGDGSAIGAGRGNESEDDRKVTMRRNGNGKSQNGYQPAKVRYIFHNCIAKLDQLIRDFLFRLCPKSSIGLFRDCHSFSFTFHRFARVFQVRQRFFSGKGGDFQQLRLPLIFPCQPKTPLPWLPLIS